MTTINYKTVFANIIFILALFPYVTPFNFSFDTQPWAITAACIFTAILFLKEKIILPTFFKILLMLTIYAGVIFSFSLIIGKSDLFMGVRSIVGYISILIFSFVSYKTFNLVKTKYFVIGVAILLMVGLSQFIFGIDVIAPFVSRFSTGGARGLTSLSSEPAFYASLCVAFLVLNEIFFSTKRYGVKLYCLIFSMSILQIILSYSAVGIMLLILFGIGKLFEVLFIKEVRQKKLLAIISIVVIVISITLFFNNKLLGEKRAGEVLQQSVSAPVVLMNNNMSVSRRLMNPIVGIYGGLIETRGLGVGIGTKEGNLVPSWLSKFIGSEVRFQGRIEGGLVSIVYELGIVGVFYLTTLLWLVLMSIINNEVLKPVFIISLLALFIPMFIFGSIAFPLLGYIIGIHFYYINNQKVKDI